MAFSSHEIVFVSGANTGLGFELAKTLLAEHGDRFYVLVGARTPSKGESAVKQLHDQGLRGCEFVEIDVTSNESIAAAAKHVEQKFGKLDVLHVNSGIAPDKDMLPAGEPISKIIMETMSVNVAGAAQTADTFIPLLKKAENPRIIFTSSGLGSITLMATVIDNSLWPAYSASKAALNAIMLWFWHRFPEMKVNATNPGFRATALNNFGQGGGRPPGPLAGGVKNAVRLTLLGKNGESGTSSQYVDAEDTFKPVPW